jgi:hypothetical protein
MDKVGRHNLLLYIIAILLFTSAAHADGEKKENSHVVNQKPYSSNRLLDHKVVIESEKHGRGTFYNYPSYRHPQHSVKYRDNRATDHNHYPAQNRIYRSPQPSVTYYYSTPLPNGGYVQIQNQRDIYNNRGVSRKYNRILSGIYPGYPAQPENQGTYFQKYRTYPYYSQPQSIQHNIDTRPTSCLGLSCGK